MGQAILDPGVDLPSTCDPGLRFTPINLRPECCADEGPAGDPSNGEPMGCRAHILSQANIKLGSKLIKHVVLHQFVLLGPQWTIDSHSRMAPPRVRMRSFEDAWVHVRPECMRKPIRVHGKSVGLDCVCVTHVMSTRG